MDDSQNVLTVDSRIIANGVTLVIEGREFPIEFPEAIWRETPPGLRRTLRENLAFGNTHFLPLILDKETVRYDFPHPLLESFLFQNQLYDMTCSEKADQAETTSYLRRLYNLSFDFERGDGALPGPEDWPSPDPLRPSAVLPFTFGKESLATAALCMELGIRPVLVYCQEPAHPHEEEHKRRKLAEFGERFGVATHFVKNAPGHFRYGTAFQTKIGTELGWGSQTTLLALLCLPFAHAYRAEWILLGNEYANNEFSLSQGWKVYASFDQTSFWAQNQNNMVRILTGGRMRVKSSLEPLEEMSIFSLLHHRYPEIGPYQFSCSGEKPLIPGTSWCHNCYKCGRMFLFARCCGVDPESLGFKEDLLQRQDLFSHYFGTDYKTGSPLDLDFAFSVLHQRRDPSPLLQIFARDKLGHIPPWPWFLQNFTTLRPEENLPDPYRERMLSIFSEEIDHFKSILPPEM